MKQLGTHTDNEWEQPEYEYTGDIPTDMQVAEAEISDLKRKIKEMKALVVAMELIENTALFRIDGLYPSLEMDYIKLRENLYRKIKFN